MNTITRQELGKALVDYLHKTHRHTLLNWDFLRYEVEVGTESIGCCCGENSNSVDTIKIKAVFQRITPKHQKVRTTKIDVWLS